jgi:hypothetical protein
VGEAHRGGAPFFFRDVRIDGGPTVEAMWGAPQAHEERSMIAVSRLRRSA